MEKTKTLKKITDVRRKKLRRDINELFDEYRISKKDLAMTLGVEYTIFCRMLSGHRPIALAKRFDDARALVDEKLKSHGDEK